MERTDWMHMGIDPSQARFLMLTAITHHNFGSPAWGEARVRRLYAELTAIDAAAAKAILDGPSSRGGPAQPAFGAVPAGSPRTSRLRRLLGWLRLDFRRDRDVLRTFPNSNSRYPQAW
jgi:hypothetical protein